MRIGSVLQLAVLLSVLGTGLAKHHYVPGEPVMGVEDSTCDDGQKWLYVDWDGNPADYQCSFPWNIPVFESDSLVYCHPPGTHEPATHRCMSAKIEYEEIPPLSGDHRPLWAKYGEYRFLPPQRWIHNMEHGAVVLLYHPCVDQDELTKLKNVLRSCLRRHIITPYRYLSIEKPFVLATWGCSLSMTYADVYSARSFIKSRARRGPEDLSKEGQFDDQLTHHAGIVPGSDVTDSVICPNALNYYDDIFEE